MPACDAKKILTPKTALFLFTVVNFINYVDRGIIPGAGTSIQGCVYDEQKYCPKLVKNQTLPSDWCVRCPLCGHHCESVATCGDQCDEKSHEIRQLGFAIGTTKLGMVQASFMIGYSLAALFFGNAVHRFSKFRLMGVGLLIWTLAVLLCGLSGILCESQQAAMANPSEEQCSAFYLLVFARILSGVGEASFATISVPILDEVVERRSIGLYLAIYFSAIPVGTALGFIWGGLISRLYSWKWAFLFEVPLMLPFAFLFLNLTGNPKPAVDVRPEAAQSADSDESLEMMVGEDEPAVKGAWQEIRSLLANPIYLCVCFGYAAYTATVAGFAFYAPKFLQTNNPCGIHPDPSDHCVNEWNFSQLDSDKIFGSIVAATGLLGTVAGGKILDHFKGKTAPDSVNPEEVSSLGSARRLELCRIALLQISAEIFIAMPVCVLAVQSSKPPIFFAGIALGCFLLFTTTAGVNGVLLWAVPKENQAMSIGLSVMFIHALGDVPSPIAIGKITDSFHDPRLTMSLTTLWLTWAIVCWLLAYFLVLGKSCTGCPCLTPRKYRREPALDGAGETLLSSGGGVMDNAMESVVSYDGLMD
jgi:MFS transporter, Spinster family, sphingosine-1-phosphate transporter|eukprot:g4368.t1